MSVDTQTIDLACAPVGTQATHLKLNVEGWRVECIRHQPEQPSKHPPILFLHGIFVGAWCWQHFLKDFADHGYDAWAISFRGHGRSSRGGNFALRHFIADAQAAVDEIHRQTGQKPIVVGHSMGGLVLQQLMLKRRLKAAVLLCSMPPQGLWPLAWQNFVLHPAQMTAFGHSLWQQSAVSAEQLRFGLFAQEVDEDVLERIAIKTVTESPQLWQDLLQGAWFTPWLRNCPVAVVAASEDTLVPMSVSHMTAISYATKVNWLEGFGHGVMLEKNWPQASAYLRGIIHQISH